MTQPTKKPSPSSLTDDYYHVGLIGEGEFGKVYEYVSKNDGKSYAVKKLNKHKLPSLLTSREKTNQKSIKHRNILPIIEALEDNVFIYLIMPKMVANLDNLIEKGYFFSGKDIVVFTSKVASGLSHLHGMNIAHRDLKPENILFDEDGEIKIADFGSSKLMTADSILNTSGVGTPLYMAPELFEMHSDHKAKYNTAVDMWSLGIMLMEFTDFISEEDMICEYEEPQEIMDDIRKRAREGTTKIMTHPNFEEEWENLLDIVECLITAAKERYSANQVLELINKINIQCNDIEILNEFIENEIVKSNKMERSNDNNPKQKTRSYDEKLEQKVDIELENKQKVRKCKKLELKRIENVVSSRRIVAGKTVFIRIENQQVTGWIVNVTENELLVRYKNEKKITEKWYLKTDKNIKLFSRK